MEIGVPRYIVSYGGTQFTSHEFKDFTRMWVYSMESHHPPMQSNVQAEHFVKTIKNSLTNAMEVREDLHLAILSYITTSLNHSLPLPAELLNSRKFRCSDVDVPRGMSAHIWVCVNKVFLKRFS